MKKKIALLLAAVMTASMLPMSVFAVSSNTVNKTVTVVQDEFITEGSEGAPILSINPKDVVGSGLSGTSIKLVLEGAEWAFDNVATSATSNKWAHYPDKGTKSKNAQWVNFSTGDNFKDYELELSSGVSESTILKQAVENQNVIPWKLEVSAGDPKVALVTLAPMNSTWLKTTNVKDSAYEIPLIVKCIKEGELKVTVDAGGTVISNSTHVFATGTSTSGATVTTVSEVATGRDDVQIKPLAVKETVANTLKAGNSITLQLSGNFEFKSGQTLSIASDYRMSGIATIAPGAYSYGKDTITFTIPTQYGSIASTRLDTMYISTTPGPDGLIVSPIDEDEDYGDINLVIKGTNITRETVKVGVRKDYGFDFKTTKDIPTLLVGRVANNFIPNGKTTGTFDNRNTGVDEDQTEAAEIHFTETIKNTWLDTRKLVFTVPEGVKIQKVEFENVKYITKDLGSAAEISKDGRSVSLVDVGPNVSELSEFKMKTWLSMELGFEGDVVMDVSGGGITAGTVPGVVIAKAVSPISIESKSTSTNMGYQKIDTADITITETAMGTFVKDKEVTVNIDSVYGSSEMGFADENISYEIVGGDLKIKNFRVKGGTIRFDVDRESKTGPSAVVIKNVKIGSTRSVPFGSYDLLVGGTAFVTNYDYSEKMSLDYWPVFDNNEGYKFADYIKVITETGTLDEVVKVSIGSSTCLINDVATEMDVAPYIQAASGSTMVPLRFVSLALGIDSVESADESSKVQWAPNTKTVTIFYAAGTSITPIQFMAGSNEMSVGGTKIPMISPSGQPVVAEITDSRMFVPFRALGDALGVKVTWDDATRTAIYNQK